MWEGANATLALHLVLPAVLAFYNYKSFVAVVKLQDGPYSSILSDID